MTTLRSHKKFDFRTAYIDLLLNLLTGTVVLLILTALLIAPITKKTEGIKKNADYIITMEWPEKIDCDLDLWVRDPMNNIVSYAMKESGMMYYERDDMGQRASIFHIDGKDMVVDPDNKEYITFRGTLEGEYVVNVHVYSCVDPNSPADAQKALPKGASTFVPIPVVVEVTKVNPDLVMVKHVQLTMIKVDEEQTAVRFLMNDDKTIFRFMYDFVSIRTDNKG